MFRWKVVDAGGDIDFVVRIRVQRTMLASCRQGDIILSSTSLPYPCMIVLPRTVCS